MHLWRRAIPLDGVISLHLAAVRVDAGHNHARRRLHLQAEDVEHPGLHNVEVIKTIGPSLRDLLPCARFGLILTATVKSQCDPANGCASGG